jgi:hypothetical protein
MIYTEEYKIVSYDVGAPNFSNSYMFEVSEYVSRRKGGNPDIGWDYAQNKYGHVIVVISSRYPSGIVKYSRYIPGEK